MFNPPKSFTAREAILAKSQPDELKNLISGVQIAGECLCQNDGPVEAKPLEMHIVDQL